MRDNNFSLHRKRLSISLVLIFVLAATPTAGQSLRGSALTRVNLRTCPSAKTCPAVKTLEPKAELEILHQQGDWLNVRAVPEGQAGWVHSKYVSRSNIPSGASANPGLSAARSRTFTNTLHVLAFLPLLGILVFGLTKKQLEARAGQKPARDPFGDLAFSPKIAASWLFLIGGGAFGYFLGRGGIVNGMPLLGGTQLLQVVELFGYCGWALYWGVPACFRWWRKLATKLMVWGVIGCPATIFLLILGLVISTYYSYFGGGTFEFFKYWWRSRRLA